MSLKIDKRTSKNVTIFVLHLQHHPQIRSCLTILNAKESNDSLIMNNTITIYPHGEFSPIVTKWQKEKCKKLQLTFIIGIQFGNESFVKNTDLHQLVPTKERRISPDGNCLFSSLSFVITGADRFHREIRELLLENMRSTDREKCTNYCSSHYELLQEHRCRSIDDYIINSRMESIGSWGTDLEIFLAAQILKTDIFIYRDCFHNWSRSQGTVLVTNRIFMS